MVNRKQLDGTQGHLQSHSSTQTTHKRPHSLSTALTLSLSLSLKDTLYALNPTLRDSAAAYTKQIRDRLLHTTLIL